MARVTFYPEGKSVEVKRGTTIMQAARAAGVVIEVPCNGTGTCGKCKVKLDTSSLKNVIIGKHGSVSEEEVKTGLVMSCQALIEGDLRVELADQQKNESLKIINQGECFTLDIRSTIHKVHYDDKGFTEVYGDGQLLGVEPGNTQDHKYGIVVDIGTTTVVVSLTDLEDGRELGFVSALNPQAVHAQDVLSRINIASEVPGLHLMYEGVTREINRLISQVAREAEVSTDNIYEVIYSGNTCMLHLAVGLNPVSLGKYPYVPELKGAIILRAADHNLSVSPFGRIYLPPIISAYLGADITSGVLAAQLHQKQGVTLFVDIGTNGEMVLGKDGALTATSTAAGPAFEGMNISQGMRASDGAIEFFQIQEDDGISVKTIGDMEAMGICGSGLLDIVGELAAAGVIKKNGKFLDPDTPELSSSLKERLIKKEGKTAFQVAPGVILTQKDVRQVQLAKGAVRSGIEFLLTNQGIRADAVDKVLIAGSFGFHLRAKSLINIGLLPGEFAGKMEFIGNTSKSGGEAFLLNGGYRAEMEGVVKRVKVVELANHEDFDRIFVKHLNF